MREIKFRAYLKKNNIIVKVLEWISNGRIKVSIQDSGPFLIRDVDDFILMQYTGLKDKNGKDIYEGDIVTLNYGAPPTVARLVIEYSDNEIIDDISVSGWWMRNTKMLGCSSSLCRIYEGDLEIIGNINENPELLTRKDP